MGNNRRSFCALIHPRRMTAFFLALLMVFSAIPMAQAASLSVSCSANKSKANVGDNLTASMKASGGSGSYQYAWIVTCNGIEKDMTPYGNYTQWTYRADQEGTWKFQAYVMDKETDKTASAICTITVGDTSSGGSSSDTESSTPVSVSVTRGQSSADVGDTISAIATAKGGSGNYLYTWKVRLNGSTVHTVSNITTRNYSYYTNKAGKWTFRVTVTDVETGETDTDTTSTITVSEAEPDPLSVSVSKTKSSAKVGETIGAICSAEGGSEDYNYAWEVHCNGSMVYNTDFNYGSSFNYKPDRAGSWSFKVYVEDTETGERKSASTGSITVVADETCKHTSTKNVKDDSYNSWVRANDDETHEVFYVYNVVCSSCGYVVKKGEIYESNDPHTFNSKGICTACGYEEECSHSQTYESIRGQDGLGSSLSSTQHEIDYIYAVICSGCGEELREVIRTSTENHVFDANGDCTMCDYRVACKHTSTKLVKADEVYTVLNATQHKYTVIYDRYCANAACGKLVEYGIQEEEKQNHSFSGNTCTKCHYTKAEELSVSVSRGQTSTEVGNIISATASVSGGSGKYQIAWSVSCNGVQMNMTDYSMNTYYGYNAYQAGSWRFTVYVRDANTGETRNATTDVISVAEAVCRHPSSIEMYLRTDYEKISDANHYEKKLYQKSCASCGEITNSGFYRTETKPHSLDSSGRCICGYVKTVCQHKNLTEKQVGSELRQSNLDSSRHIITYYYQDTCRDCGVVVNARREKTATAAHYLENGKCACGYVEVKPEDTCDHAPERTLISTDLALENKEMHRIVRVYRYTCQCGQVDYESTQESYAYHSWNAQGVCACGQAAPVTPVPVTPPPVTPVPVTPVPVTPAPITPAPVTPGPGDQPLPEGECDHIPQRVPGDVKRVNRSEKVHEVITQYHFFCACGQVDYWAEVSGVYEEHQYTSRGHVQARHDPDGHATFNRCPCGATEMTGKYTTYSECCTCNGHKWGEAYQENNEWKHQCQRRTCNAVELIEEMKPCEHSWEITDQSQAMVHPTHEIEKKCSLCGVIKIEKVINEICCLCGGNVHSFDLDKTPSLSNNLISPIKDHPHKTVRYCDICKRYIEDKPLVQPYYEDCIYCNPNRIDPNVTFDGVTSVTMYEYVRDTEWFADTFLYAPDGGTWYSDANTLSTGFSAGLFEGHYTYAATYLTKEQTADLYRMLSSETKDKAWKALKAWMLDLAGDAVGNSSKGKEVVKDAEILNYAADNFSQKLTQKDLDELKSTLMLIPDLPERDAMDLIDLFSDIPVLGTVLNVYDFIQVLDYNSKKNDLKDAVSKNKGVVVEHQMRWTKDVYGSAQTYVPHKQYYPGSKVSLWEGSYMDDDFLLYGTYTPGGNQAYIDYINGQNTYEGTLRTDSVVTISQNGVSLYDKPGADAKAVANTSKGKQYTYIGTTHDENGKRWYAVRDEQRNIVYLDASKAYIIR